MIIEYITKEGETIRLMDGMETPMMFFIPSDYLAQLVDQYHINFCKSYPSFINTCAKFYR